MKDVYKRLAEKLDQMPVAFPETESGIELKILARWFSPEEAETALGLSAMPEPVPGTAKRMEREPESLKTELDAMAGKGCILRIHGKNGPLYCLAPFAEGMWEFHVNNLDEEVIRDHWEYLPTFLERGWFGTPTSQRRIIPIEENIPAGTQVLPFDSAMEIIKTQEKFAVTECICRKEHRLLGQGCEHPLEVCLVLGRGVDYYVDTGLGRKITREEALEVLEIAKKAGLVLLPGNSRNPSGICMCCICACHILKTLKKMAKPAQLAHSNYYAHVDTTACTACESCIEACPMEALGMKDNTAKVDQDRCIGCGVCVGACDFDAMGMNPKGNPYQPLETRIELLRQMAMER